MMKRLFAIFFFCTAAVAVHAQNAGANPARAKIDASYEIPAYNIYLHDWDTLQVHPRSLAEVFGDNADIKIILVENNNPFTAPLRETELLTSYGIRKDELPTGVRLTTAPGDSVFCCFDGVVRIARRDSDGATVVVRHYNGLETVYGHLRQTCVSPNEIVTAGTPVGIAEKDYLLFETRFLYEHFNPEKMMDCEEGTLLSNIITLYKEELAFETENSELQAAGQLNQIYHIVKQGDTLSSIAHKHHISVERICALNHLKAESVLQLGQKIKIQ